MLIQYSTHQELVIAGGNGLRAAVNQAEPLTGPCNNTTHLPLSRRMPCVAENRANVVLPIKLANQFQN